MFWLQAATRHKRVLVNFIIAGLDVYRDDLPDILVRRHLCTEAVVVDVLSQPGNLRVGQSWMRHSTALLLSQNEVKWLSLFHYRAQWKLPNDTPTGEFDLQRDPLRGYRCNRRSLKGNPPSSRLPQNRRQLSVDVTSSEFVRGQ